MSTTRTLAFVGSLNRDAPYFGKPQGRGITVLSFVTGTGALSPLSETLDIDNPTFLVVAADGRTLYATSEMYGWHEGVVTAYRINPDASLTYINKQATGGSIAAQAIVDPSGSWLLVANYRMGEAGVRTPLAVAVFPIEADGGIGPLAHGVTHSGSGPHADRQEGPHPHCVLATANGRHVLVADLGIDRVIAYAFDGTRGALTHVADVALPPGTGPRHLAWVAPGLAVVSGELDNSVTSLAWDGVSLRIVARAPIVPEGFAGISHAADIHVSPDGRFVYASNRGHDSLAILSVGPGGQLAPAGHRATLACPRNFTLNPTGDFALVASQDGHDIATYRRDSETGGLRPLANFAIGSPMCVRLAEVPVR